MSFLEIGVIGDTKTGKTNLINIYNNLGFSKDTLITIGLNYYIKEIKSSNNIKFKLKILDTAGCEQYHSLSLNILKRCKGIILVYSIDDKQSFENVKNIWINDIKDYLNISNIPIILVGNKIDLKNERIISEEEGRKLAKDNNFLFFETSAKTGENVNEIFQALIEILVKDIQGNNNNFNPNNKLINNNNNNNKHKKNNNDKIDKEGKCKII